MVNQQSGWWTPSGVAGLPKLAVSVQVNPQRLLAVDPSAEMLKSRRLASYCSGKLPPCVWPVNPFRLNERLTVQRGVFLAPADVRRSFAVNLQSLQGYNEESKLCCFVLPRTAMAKMGEELYRGNVTETTLFQGIDGFARSLFNFRTVSGSHRPEARERYLMGPHRPVLGCFD